MQNWVNREAIDLGMLYIFKWMIKEGKRGRKGIKEYKVKQIM